MHSFVILTNFPCLIGCCALNIIDHLQHFAQQQAQIDACDLYYNYTYRKRQIPTCLQHIFFKNAPLSSSHCHLTLHVSFYAEG